MRAATASARAASASSPAASRHGRVLVADRADARARRRDDRLTALGERPLEDVDVVPHEARRVVLVAGVRVHLPAARLRLREDDLVAEPLEDGHGGPGDVGEEDVAEAGDEEGDPHAGLLAGEPVDVDARATPVVLAVAMDVPPLAAETYRVESLRHRLPPCFLTSRVEFCVTPLHRGRIASIVIIRTIPQRRWP